MFTKLTVVTHFMMYVSQAIMLNSYEFIFHSGMG